MIKCDICGKLNEDCSKYCNNCGQLLDLTIINLNKYDRLIKKYNLNKSQENELKTILSNNTLYKNPTEKTIVKVIHEIILNSFNDKIIVEKKELDNYEQELLKLKKDYKLKIEKTEKIINEEFTHSKITQYYFNSHIDNFKELFDEEVKIIEKIINLDEKSEILEKEVDKKINLLKLMLNKINSLINELIININNINEEEITNILEEMNHLIKSVKDY